MKYTVLVVDDESLIARNIKRSIEKGNPNFEVIGMCSTGTEALEFIESNPPQVVFTDIRMPKMDGLELVKNISAKYPFITCVIVSGYNDFEYAKTAMECNVKYYILKPINRDELGKCLSRIENTILSKYPGLENTIDNNSTLSSEEIVELIKTYIHENYKSVVDFGEMAKNLGFSQPYLTKVFSKHVEKNPSTYLKEYRVSIAKQLLADKSNSLSTISEQTGFFDQFHLSKSFKAVTGMSPSEYRQHNCPSE